MRIIAVSPSAISVNVIVKKKKNENKNYTAGIYTAAYAIRRG